MVEPLQFDLPDEAATHALAVALAPYVAAGDVIALHGGLGAGKTSFARGLIGALCGAGIEVPSPTYTLVQAYDGPDFPIWHFDLYRIESPDEVFELAWDETQDGLALIEWPGRAGGHLPAWRLDLTLAQNPDANGGARTATLEPHGEDWQNRMNGFRF